MGAASFLRNLLALSDLKINLICKLIGPTLALEFVSSVLRIHGPPGTFCLQTNYVVTNYIKISRHGLFWNLTRYFACHENSCLVNIHIYVWVLKTWVFFFVKWNFRNLYRVGVVFNCVYILFQVSKFVHLHFILSSVRTSEAMVCCKVMY